jgi:hypothetical protein
MHRSGTSLMSRWLAQSGLSMVVGGSIGPDISNPEGYYEDLDFVRLHAGHIRRAAAWSSGWKYAPDQWQRFTPAERQCGLNLVTTRGADHADWGWKDPRATLFLTEWKAIIPDLKVILVWRPCAEVVSSLITRCIKQHRLNLMIDPVSAVRLWLAYNRLVCAYAARFPDETVVVAAARLPAHGNAVREKINEWSGGRLLMLPLEDVYDAELLHPARAWLQRLCGALGCNDQEMRLEALTLGKV